jgi:hypothetical protein
MHLTELRLVRHGMTVCYAAPFLKWLNNLITQTIDTVPKAPTVIKNAGNERCGIFLRLLSIS